MKYVIVPYKIGSQSAKRIQEGIVAAGHRCMRVRPDSTTYRPRPTDRIIYYGGSTTNFQSNCVINPVRTLANNKLTTLQRLQEANLSTVEWTTHKDVANDWINQKEKVVARSILSGHSGMGITVWDNLDNPLPNVPLYTKYLKKTYECRVHVFNGRVIDAQIKRKKTTGIDATQKTNTLIRNIHTGWVYCREDFTLPPAAAELSIAAVNAVNLNFGAVDLIYNKYYNKFHILEINSAPGLDGTTLDNYIQAFLLI